MVKRNAGSLARRRSLYAPIAICPLRSQTVMLQPRHVAHPIEQFLFGLAVGRRCDYKRIHDSVFIGSPRGKQADYTE
jgi:hypothetical protein